MRGGLLFCAGVLLLAGCGESGAVAPGPSGPTSSGGCPTWAWVQRTCASDAAGSVCNAWAVYYDNRCPEADPWTPGSCRAAYADTSPGKCVETACGLYDLETAGDDRLCL